MLSLKNKIIQNSVERGVSNALEKSDRVPPQSAKSNAQKVLKWREEHGDEVKGMTSVGWTRASQLASGEALSEDTIKRMAQFARHEKNAEIDPKYKSTPWKDNGYVAWLGWGGTTGISWAKRLSDRMRKDNAKQECKIYYARHMERGIARYKDEDVYVSNDAIKRMCRSFEGKPLVVDHQDIQLENIQEQADGYVSDCFYCEEDGWFWAKFVAVSDAAHEAISKGWRVSNAYYPELKEKGGTINNVPYDREVVGGSFDHLAIVDNPRYEGAIIMSPEEFKSYKANARQELEALKNSVEDKPKSEKVKNMFNIFKKEKVAVENSADLENAFATFEGSPEEGVAVSEMIEAYKNAKKDEEKEEEKAENKCSYNMDDEVEVNGQMVKIRELANAYMKKKNAEDEEEEKANEDKKAEEESKEQAKKNAKEEAEEGKKHFEGMQSAIQNGLQAEQVSEVRTRQDSIELGKKNF